MSVELAIPAGQAADADRRTRIALVFIVAFLAVEPPLRALLWLTEPGARHALHSDMIWLSLALCLTLAVPLTADIRAVIARRRGLIVAGLVWAIAAAGSALLIDNPAPGTAIRWPFYLGFGLCLLAALHRRPADCGPLLVAAVLGFLGLTAALAAFLAFTSLPADFDWVTQLPGAFNVRNLGYEALAVVMVGSLYRPASMPIVMLMRLSAVVGWAFLFWSGGRGSLLAAVMTLGGLAVIADSEGRRRRLAETALLAATGAGLSLLHTAPNAAFGFWRAIGFDTMAAGGQSSTDISTGRLAIWTESVRVIAAHPWFGIGEGQMRHHLSSALGTFPQPHNVVLQGPIAWGLAGGTAFLVAIAFPLWRALHRSWRRNTLGSAATAGLAVALAMAIQSMVDGTLFHPRPVIMFLIGCGIALAAPQRTDGEASTSGS